MQQLVLFQTGNMKFALDRNCISRTRPIPERSTDSWGRVRKQTIDDEGRALILIDLAAGSNQDATAPNPSDAQMIMINSSPPIALWADRIKRPLEADGHRMEDLPPVFAGTACACFPKVLCLEDQLALVIDINTLAELECYTDAAPTVERTRQNPNEDKRKISRAENPLNLHPLQARTLEAVVGEKLRQFIEQRVQEMVTKAMAQALERQTV